MTSETESQVTIELTKSAENSRGKTGRGRWYGLKSIQIDQAQCDANAKSKDGSLRA
jgi:hypothetical protein